MSKLSEILAARKAQTNGATPQPILQSEPIKAAEQTTPQEKQRDLGVAQSKPSILDKFKPKSATSGPVDNTPRQLIVETRTETPIQPAVAEQSRPLTLAEKLRARTQHVQVSQLAQERVSVSEKTPIQTVQNTEILQSSASQTADAQKTNDGTVNIEELKRNLAYLANNIENKDLVADVVRTIAVQIKNYPELFPHMTRGDVNLMVRGLRMAYQIAAMKKQEKKSSVKKNDAAVMEISQMMKDAGIDFSGLKL